MTTRSNGWRRVHGVLFCEAIILVHCNGRTFPMPVNSKRESKTFVSKHAIVQSQSCYDTGCLRNLLIFRYGRCFPRDKIKIHSNFKQIWVYLIQCIQRVSEICPSVPVFLHSMSIPLIENVMFFTSWSEPKEWVEDWGISEHFSVQVMKKDC